MGYSTASRATAVWQPELPHHLFFKSELLLFQGGTKESLKQIIPNYPHKVFIPMNTDVHIYQQHNNKTSNLFWLHATYP